MSTTLHPAPVQVLGAPSQQPEARPSARFHPPGSSLASLTSILAWLGFLAAAEAVAGGIAGANWQPGLTGLPWLAALAVVLGAPFTRFGRLRSVTFWIFWGVGLFLGLLVAVRLPGSAFLPSGLGWQEQVYAILARLSGWVENSLAGKVVQDDTLIALAIACFVYFWLYTCSLLALRFKQTWLGAGLVGAPLFTNVMLKQNAGAGWLVPWAAGALGFILGQSVQRRERFYQQRGFTGWRRGNRLALGAGLLMSSAALAVFAFAPPVSVNDTLNHLYQKLNGPIGQAQRAYNELGVPKQYDASAIRGDSFQSQLRFLGPFRPGNDLVMKVGSDRPRYEQGLVFDHYDHSGWTNTRFSQFENNRSIYSTLTALRDTAQDHDRVQIAQEITAVKPAGALLFAAPQPLGASVGLKGDGFGDLRATSVIAPGQHYTSASLESTATAEVLAATNGAIPADVRDAFLQLPPDVPPRIKQLAQQQTAGQTSAFDKAEALEAFLRTYPYDTEVPPPPAGRDGVDWFLFDERRGYCDYLSSAMAVMLRTLGVPARVVAGYAPGQLDPTDGLYHITERDTHTWTQAYIPGYGWIDFEPSAIEPQLPRMHSPRQSPTPGADQVRPTPNPQATPTIQAGRSASSSGGGAPGSRRQFAWWLLILLGAILGGLYLYIRLRGAPGARLAYRRLALAGSLLGLRPRAWQTPREYGLALQARRGFDRGATQVITTLYGTERYSGRPLDVRANRRAWAAWQHLKARLLQPWRRRSSP
jgi:transglutaminase-like putative cysteine protease